MRHHRVLAVTPDLIRRGQPGTLARSQPGHMTIQLVRVQCAGDGALGKAFDVIVDDEILDAGVTDDALRVLPLLVPPLAAADDDRHLGIDLFQLSGFPGLAAAALDQVEPLTDYSAVSLDTHQDGI